MNATRCTQRYIMEHPAVKDCLARGLVNYSALAREICRSCNIKAFDAVLMACRRYARRVKDAPAHERRILQLIRKAKLRVRSKILVAIVERPKQFNRLAELQVEIRADDGDINLIEGEDVVTIITNEEYEPLLRTKLRGSLKRITRSLAQIAMIFDSRIETTSGVVSYIYGLLAEQGINVLEEMSCWTDLIFVIEEDDLARAIKALDL